MIQRLKVLLLPPPPELGDPWQKDVVEAMSFRHDLRICNYSAPLPPQFEDVDVVIDLGEPKGQREMANLATSVRLWQILSNGFDNIDLDYWRQKKIPVANCPGQFSAIALAECALMFMLMLARRWRETQINLRQGIFNLPLGLELEKRRLGIIGFGASGRELTRLAMALSMRVAAIDIRDISLEEQRQFGLDFVGKPRDIDKVTTECDYLSLHLHLNNETRHIIDDRRLRLMKRSACLINVARGALVDEQALYRVLVEGQIAGAGLDVFSTEPVDPNHPLLNLPNVVATPHISGETNGTSRRRAACAAENVDRIAAGLDPLYRID